MANLSILDDGAVTAITFNRPILTRAVLTELGHVLTVLAARDRPSPIVLASAHPTIFLAGAHLAEIAELDPVTDYYDLPDTGTVMTYTYDFGDHWEFEVKLEKIKAAGETPAKPEIVEERGEAPEQYPSWGDEDEW